MDLDGVSVPVRPGQTVAGALWAAGRLTWRTTRVAGRPRGLYCGIGACHDCLLTIDGVPGQRACVTPARPDTVLTTEVPLPPASVRERPPDRGRYDIVVVGAGPAGLAAAATAALAGVRVALLDSAPRPGGQFWRHRDGETGAHGYRDWSILCGLTSVIEERVDYIPDATVWFAQPDLAQPDVLQPDVVQPDVVQPDVVRPGFVLQTTAGPFEADRVVLATGAYDRSLPFPGWDLPGVVTPGAAQALLKGSGVALGTAVVVAGAGPFLLPVAVGLAEAGVRVVGVYEAGNPGSYLRRPAALAGVAGKLTEAAGYAATLARRRIPYRTGHAVVAARGNATGVSGVDIARLADGRMVPGSVRRVDCDAVAVGYGFTANLELALALGCGTRRSADGGLAVLVNGDGQTTVRGVYAAGEITGVGGSTLSTVEGSIAGSAAAGTPAPLSARELVGLRRRRDRLRAFADVMHAAHAIPAGWADWLTAETVVCRCEEVSYGQLASAVTDLGGTDARTVKLLARPGMGLCQGRVCGHATAELTARLCGRPVQAADLAAFAARPLASPVTLAELAEVAEVAELGGTGGLAEG